MGGAAAPALPHRVGRCCRSAFQNENHWHSKTRCPAGRGQLLIPDAKVSVAKYAMKKLLCVMVATPLLLANNSRADAAPLHPQFKLSRQDEDWSGRFGSHRTDRVAVATASDVDGELRPLLRRSIST